MRKIFTIFCFVVSAINLKAQVELKQVIPISYPGISGFSAPTGICDTLNAYKASNRLALYYQYRGGGAVNGTNNLKATQNTTVLEDANYFDVTDSSYNFITGGLVYFSFANSNTVGNMNKNVVFKIYDDADGKPGNLIGSTSLTLAQIRQDVVNGKLTSFTLPSPVNVPASKKFYVSVDHSNFTWFFPTQDSLAIVATGNHSTPNAAYQLINKNSVTAWTPDSKFWKNFDNSDSLEITLFVFPVVRNSLTSCDVLPVSMFNFGGFIKDYTAILNWSTAGESNNKGFYIERSKDGRNFSSLAFVNGAGNSSQIKNYTYTDASLKDIGVTTTYYRLKQVDLDGKSVYSNVISLNLKNALQWRLYPNPVKNVATVELNLTASSKVNVQVISRDGRILINTDKGILNQGVQQIYINTQGLAKGSYIVRVKTDTDTYSMPVVKD